MITGFRRIHWIWAAILGIALLCISFGAAQTGWLTAEKEKTIMSPAIMSPAIMSLAITSPSFPHNGAIPARHTCDGLNVSPTLAWAGVPAGTKSLALIVDDPDAPDPNCKHSIKTMYPNVRTVSGVAVYQCHECGRIVTALGVIVLNAKEISP